MVYAISLALPLGELSMTLTERASPCAKLQPTGRNKQKIAAHGGFFRALMLYFAYTVKQEDEP